MDKIVPNTIKDVFAYFCDNTNQIYINKNMISIKSYSDLFAGKKNKSKYQYSDISDRIKFMHENIKYLKLNLYLVTSTTHSINSNGEISGVLQDTRITDFFKKYLKNRCENICKFKIKNNKNKKYPNTYIIDFDKLSWQHHISGGHIYLEQINTYTKKNRYLVLKYDIDTIGKKLDKFIYIQLIILFLHKNIPKDIIIEIFKFIV